MSPLTTARHASPDPRIELLYQTQLLKMDRDFGRLNTIRTRTVSLLAAATLLVSFSIALGFINENSSNGTVTPTWASVSLMVLLVVILVLVWFVMSTAKGYMTSTSVEDIQKWIKSGYSEDALKLAIIDDMAKKTTHNNHLITVRRRVSVCIMSLITLAAIVVVAASAFRPSS